MERQRFHPFDSFLARVTQERTQQYIDQYATHDGIVDKQLAGHIELELKRRAETGKELDIYEPLRWTVAQTVLSIAGAIGIKLTTEKSISRPAMAVLSATTILTSSIQLMRLYPRFKAGLSGGLDVAIAMNNASNGHKKLDWASTIASKPATAPGSLGLS